MHHAKHEQKVEHLSTTTALKHVKWQQGTASSAPSAAVVHASAPDNSVVVQVTASPSPGAMSPRQQTSR